MFSATDIAQMVWDSDSDDGDMEGGSDMEIEEHVSRFFCKKVGCQCHRFGIDWAGLWPFDIHRCHHLWYFYTHIIYCCWHYLDVWHISTIQWLVWITNNYTFLWLCWIQLLSNYVSISAEYMCTWQFLSGWQDVLHFCSADVTSNLSHQLLCFIMLSYCSYFIIVYNYISLISCLFILTFLFQEEEKKKKKNYVFFDQYFTQNTYTLCHFKQLKTTQIQIIQYNNEQTQCFVCQ